MARQIAVPAETLRRCARAASLKADDEEKAGNMNNAKRLREVAERAYDVAGEQSSNLVAFNGTDASTLCAFAHKYDEGYVDGLREMLYHHGVWGE